MANGHSGNGWIMTIIAGVVVVAIGGAMVGYGNDQRRDEKVDSIEKTVEQHDREIRELRDARLQTANDIKSINGSMSRMAKAIEKISERQ